MNTSKIILVFGKLCSGKGTFCANFPEHKKIVTSDVVREIIGKTSRSDLQQTSHLDNIIASELCNRIDYFLSSNTQVIVDGIRQQSIVEYILSKFNNVEMVWLEVSDEVLKQRFLARKDIKDDQTFEDAYERDGKLGLKELELWLKQNSNVKVIDHLNKS